MSELNKQQLQAVQSTADKILCLAGAGTGKTFSMLERIAKVTDEGVDPSSILVLTFTRAAAFEMKERYIKNHTGRIPTFQTFHAFCYSLIASNQEVLHKIGYSNVPAIIDESAKRRVETQVKMQCGTKLSAAQLAKEEKDLRPVDQFAYRLYHKALQKAMTSAEIITFNMLCSKVCQLFAEDDNCIQRYKQQYKYIFVDEFQDTDPTQWRFVSSFTNAKLFVVGDALQAIYSFRNADSSIIKRLAKDKSWETVKLYQNYRSTKEICDFANAHSKYADPSYRIEIKSDKKGSKVDSKFISGNSVSNDALNLMYASLSSESGSTAVLCRSNAEVDVTVDFLRNKNIEVRTGRRNTDAVNILKSAFDDEYLVDWCSTFLNSQKYAEFIRMVAIEGITHRAPFFYDKFKNYFAVGYYLNAIMTIRNILNDSDQAPFQKCFGIFQQLELKDTLVDTDAKTPEEIVNYCISVLGSEDDSGVYVGTIHSAKGLEYDNVHLLGVDGKSFKLDNEDNLNLYYVGITRAKTNLHIYQVIR